MPKPPDTLKAVSRTPWGAQSWGWDGSAGSTWCQHPTTSCCTDSPKILPVPLGKQRDHAPHPHLMKRVQRMKITSPTMLGASHHVVSGWAASAEPVLFLSSSVGLQSWSGGAHSGVSICPQPHTPHPEQQAASLRMRCAYWGHWPGRTR